MVQGCSFPGLGIHVTAALRCGASREEVVVTNTHMRADCGFRWRPPLTASDMFEK